MDVGRGSGSCNSDCDCPLCAPYCSTSGYCQNHQRAGRRKCSPPSAATGPASASTGQVPACPPLLGDPAPPGCDKTFADDEGIPCWDNTDCPDPGTCQNELCNFWVVPDYDCGDPGDPGCVELVDAFYECKRTEPDCALTAPNCSLPVSCSSGGEIITFTRSECYNYLNKITDTLPQSYQCPVHSEKFLSLLQQDDLSSCPALQERREVLRTSL